MKVICCTLITLLISLFTLQVKAQETTINVGGEVRACELTIQLIPEAKYNSVTYVFYNQSGVEVFRFTADSDEHGVTNTDLCGLGYKVEAGNYKIEVVQQSGQTQTFLDQNAFSSYSTVITLNLNQSSNNVMLGFLCCCCCLLLVLLLLLLVLLKRRKKGKSAKPKNHKA